MNPKQPLFFLLIFYLIFNFSCKESPEDSAARGTIDLKIEDYERLVSNNEITADGATKIKLIAAIPRTLPADSRRVVFKTSAGSFDTPVFGATEITVRADEVGQDTTMMLAIAYLSTGLKNGKCTISAAIASEPTIKKELQINIEPIEIRASIPFTIVDLEQLEREKKLRADGITRLHLVVSLPLDSPQDYRSVEFLTTTGQFDESLEDKKSRKVVATLSEANDKELKATADLTLGTTPGYHKLSVRLTNHESYRSDRLIMVLPRD